MAFIFNKTKDLIAQIDNFIDITAETILHFKDGVSFYVEDRRNEFEEKLAIIKDNENRADEIRKDIEAQLYRQTLIPESRGDVLGVLESMDKIINRTKSTMVQFSIEKPVFPDDIKKGLVELTEPVVLSVESLTYAVRAYFNYINAVKNHLFKVKFYEKEADILSEKIKRDIFNMKIDLSNKLHLRLFVENIDVIADYSEDVSDRIAIATIKRIV